MTSRSTTADAYHPWTTYILAREEARRRGDRRAGTEHLALGLLGDPAIESLLGVRLQGARDALDSLDRRALGAVGIDATFDAPSLPMRQTPTRPTVKAVLKDRLPLTPAAKAALQEAARPMRRGQQITPQQVLLRLLDQKEPDPVATLFATLGVDTAAVRERLTQAPTP
ncbi:MAG: Clp protease [Actinomycetota bacterium]|nr:Clp protease [Actinomycetota bacterium]MDQ6946754.1 Clp protease [Actinomycetota bacterium]